MSPNGSIASGPVSTSLPAELVSNPNATCKLHLFQEVPLSPHLEILMDCSLEPPMAALGNQAAPVQAPNLTSATAQPSSGSTTQPGLWV